MARSSILSGTCGSLGRSSNRMRPDPINERPLSVTIIGCLAWMYSAKGRFPVENLSSAVRLLPLLRVELGVGHAFEGAEAAFPDVPADRFGSVG